MSFRNYLPKFILNIIKKLYKNQFKFGFTEVDLTLLSSESIFSKTNNKWDYKFNKGFGGWLEAPNLSKGYHGLLIQWCDYYGLGKNGLLVSETNPVKEIFETKYSNTSFVCTDYYVDLIENSTTDIIWNLYEGIPDGLSKKSFDSIMCQATFEHLMDPIGVLKKFVKISNNEAKIFLHTHTPLYPNHNWPSDYLRYFPEWFHDACKIINGLELLELYSSNGHIFTLYKVNK